MLDAGQYLNDEAFQWLIVWTVLRNHSTSISIILHALLDCVSSPFQMFFQDQMIFQKNWL